MHVHKYEIQWPPRHTRWGESGSPAWRTGLLTTKFTWKEGENEVDSFCAAASCPRRPVRAFFDEFTWVLPVPHIGIVGMLTLTRWWDFWTS